MDVFKPSSKLRPLLVEPTRPFIHRDLSWVQFNSRVLGEARLATNPLLERLKFLSISSSNLDEFFMIRMAALGRSIATEVRNADNRQLQRLRRIRAVILGHVTRVVKRQNETLLSLADELLPAGVRIARDIAESPTTLALAKRVFDEKVLSELTPPTPYAPSQLGLVDNVRFAVVFPDSMWLPISKKIKPAFVHYSEDDHISYIFFLDGLLAAFAGPTFGLPGKSTIIRLTRDADVTVDLEEEDPALVPDVVLSNISKRERGRVVRLQYLGEPPREQLDMAQMALKLNPQQVFKGATTLCLHGLWSILSGIPEDVRELPGMSQPPFVPEVPHEFQDPRAIFDFLKKRDYLLHHPYDSFDAYVNWIRAACRDPDVTLIQQTVYRMDALSPIIAELKAAAATKRIRVFIELRARFDELNNLRLSEELRQAGVEVAFGFGKLKLHAKVTSVTRIEDGRERHYTHLSTGNYNAVTARQYTDLAILTAGQEIGEDARYFFEAVARGEVPQSFKHLVTAPAKLHRRIIQLIDAEISAVEAGGEGRIIGKVNTLVDEAVIEHLYRASAAGVKIDLIVRGACSLVPGVKGLSENIRVVSIVDRFLEHSRIYYFESTGAMYLSSADWMPRNFFSRLEIAFPVLDPNLHRFIAKELLPTYLTDNMKARELDADGAWKKRPKGEGKAEVRSQFRFEELSKKGYQGTALE